MIASIIIPLALDRLFSYSVSGDISSQIQIGHRVHISFRNKNYTGIVAQIDPDKIDPSIHPILEVLDDEPILTKDHIALWQWIARYYCCTLGEVMRAAFPSAMRLQFDTSIHLVNAEVIHELSLSAEEQDLLTALTQTEEINLKEAIAFFPKGIGLKIINRLLHQGVISERKYAKKRTKTKKYQWVYLTPKYANRVDEAIERCKKSSHQTNALLAFFQLRQQKNEVRLDDWLKMFDQYRPAVNALIKKDILYIEASLENRYEQLSNQEPLNPLQLRRSLEITNHFKNHKPVLLHGVTGSGKTHIYTHLIAEQLKLNKQCLYLLPEVALTAQLTRRLRSVFHDAVVVFNYRTSNTEKITIWNKLLTGQAVVILGTRSSIFLPFVHLGLIIVDESHDGSYRQQDPSPRYHARDVAVYMAKHYKAPVLLGSATPSLESYYNTQTNKYALVQLKSRYGEISMPTIQFVDMKKAYKRGVVKGIFSTLVLESIEKTLQQNRQIIIFQNRRGYHTTVSCELCNWVAGCPNCDVTLTYHKFSNKLHCHQCGYIIKVPKKCPSCAHILLKQKGYGTERIQEDLSEHFGNFVIKRLDADTTKLKKSYENIIFDFGTQKIDILVGTQMVTKGLDFNHVGLVVVLQGDQMLYYPDFRAVELSYQMLTQVSGRAGRKHKTGQVIIQSYMPDHPVFGFVTKGDYQAMYAYEMKHRKQFMYPPYVRLILFEIRHTKTDRLREAVRQFVQIRSDALAKRCLGPATPQPSKVRSYYRRQFLIKIEKNKKTISLIKNELKNISDEIKRTKGLSQTRVIIEVDP